VPLVYVTTTNPHEPFEVTVAAVRYTVVPNTTVTTYVPIEHLTPYTTAVQAADASAVVHSRPE